MDMADYTGGIVEFIILRTFISLKKSSHYTANFANVIAKFSLGIMLMTKDEGMAV